MPVTKWDKVYLGIMIVSIALFLIIYALQGATEAEKTAQGIIVPIISIILIIGIVIQKWEQRTNRTATQSEEHN